MNVSVFVVQFHIRSENFAIHFLASCMPCHFFTIMKSLWRSFFLLNVTLIGKANASPQLSRSFTSELIGTRIQVQEAVVQSASARAPLGDVTLRAVSTLPAVDPPKRPPWVARKMGCCDSFRCAPCFYLRCPNSLQILGNAYSLDSASVESTFWRCSLFSTFCVTALLCIFWRVNAL